MNQQSKPTAVLIVDDDKRIRHIIKNQLKSAGYIIFEAGTAKQAIKILKWKKLTRMFGVIKWKELNGDYKHDLYFLQQEREGNPHVF